MASDLDVFDYQKKFDIERQKATDAYDHGHDACRAYYESRGCQRCFHDYDNLEPAAMRDFDTIKTAYENYLNPSLRLKDRFYCEKHKCKLNAAVGASGGMVNVTGHVCWGYTSHPSYQQANPWFTGTFAAGLQPGDLKPGTNALTVFDETQWTKPSTGFSTYGCSMQKNLEAEDGNYEEAMLRALQMKESTYFLFVNNCMDATNFILQGFGVDHLPLPTLHTPYSYFAALPGEAVKIHSS